MTLAARTKGFGAAALRAALDSSPLWGAGRVEDTINLMGHALRKALGVIAVLQGRGQAAGTAVAAAQAGVPQLAASSLKAALDADWDDPAARDAALAEVLGLLDQVEAFIAGRAGQEAAAAAVTTARQVRGQDVDLAGWALADRLKQLMPLDPVTLPAGQTARVLLRPPIQLGNRGGLVTLLDPAGLKADGVAYTQQQASTEGQTIVF